MYVCTHTARLYTVLELIRCDATNCARPRDHVTPTSDAETPTSLHLQRRRHRRSRPIQRMTSRRRRREKKNAVEYGSFQRSIRPVASVGILDRRTDGRRPSLPDAKRRRGRKEGRSVGERHPRSPPSPPRSSPPYTLPCSRNVRRNLTGSRRPIKKGNLILLAFIKSPVNSRRRRPNQPLYFLRRFIRRPITHAVSLRGRT